MEEEITIGEWLTMRNLEKFNDKTFYFDYSNQDHISVIVLPKTTKDFIMELDNKLKLDTPTAEELIGDPRW
jgi:hypothetical protein